MNGFCADFFVLHNYVHPEVSSQRVLQTLDKLAAAFPWWNRTLRATKPRVRHLLISPCDHGPGDCMFDRAHRSDDWLDVRPGGIVRWRDIDYRSERRRVGMLTLNGAPAPNVNHFVRGVDIRLPAFDTHQCGPFCGMPHFIQRHASRARVTLRRLTPWRRANGSWLVPITNVRRQLPPSLRSRRRFRLFFAGRATKWGVRGDVFRYHRDRARFLLHDTSGRFPGTTLVNTSSPTFFAHAMRASDFCLVPLGQSDGDSDRYIPALLYGCVPVFTTPLEARPFEEVLQWDGFSITCSDMNTLPACLERVSDSELLSLRRAMGAAWPTMLWTSLHVGGAAARLPPTVLPERLGASYLGESPDDDAFSTFIAVLSQRLGL